MRYAIRDLPGFLGASLFVALPCLVTGQEPIPIGNDFQVNTYTTGQQWGPAVAATPKGGFLIVWQSEGSAGTDIDGSSIQAQRFDASGSPAGSQFQLNAYTTDDQRWPRVGSDESGNFVIVWHSKGSYETGAENFTVQGQVIGPSGNRLSGQFEVNTNTTYGQYVADVAAQPGGGFVVIWSGLGNGTDSDISVQGQRFHLDGTQAGSQFQVNAYTTGPQWFPRVAVDAAGNFVVTWTGPSYGTDTWAGSIQARRFQGDATPIGTDFQVNTYTTDRQLGSYIGANAEGAFVITWISYRGDPSYDYTIHARQFRNNGQPRNQQFQVGSSPGEFQQLSPVVVYPNGEFLVAWQQYGFPPASEPLGVLGREFTAEGLPVSDDFPLNGTPGFSNGFPAIALRPDGGFVAAWSSSGSEETDHDRGSIQSRLFQSSWIFLDGFESGDTSSWSEIVP